MRWWKGSVDWRQRNYATVSHKNLKKKLTFGDLNVDGKVVLT
jgi:hypothetical protein